MTIPLPFDNSYAQLPRHFFARVQPSPVGAPRLIRLNRALAAELNLDADWLQSPQGLDMLAGKELPPGADPIATAYAGHQFGQFVPQLGDGRAILLGEVIDRTGTRRDIQLKGAGRTPFSRGGDGRAALGPVLREYIVSEAMAALGVPTTRALAAVLTGDAIRRETLLPGAILTRVAASHIRVGTFQFFAARGDTQAVRDLADHVVARHYPEAAQSAAPYRALLASVVAAQADLVARWLTIGFIHGVMNTDNTSIAGETIDYGPCAFMDAYHPSAVFSSIDEAGRYAYANQPRIAHWNLARFAETLLPLLDDTEDAAVDRAGEALAQFSPRLEATLNAGFRAKLGLAQARDGDIDLVSDLLAVMASEGADFTLTFRRLARAGEGEDEAFLSLFAGADATRGWLARYRARLAQEPSTAGERRRAMDAENPVYIPRNHLIEACIQAATAEADFKLFDDLVEVLSHPFEERDGLERFAAPPEEHERVLQTFCGT
jgi:uncharacterized protein YdiU (UPF0061 family)